MTTSPEAVRVMDDAATGITLSVLDGVAIVRYDQPDSAVNTLNTRIGPVFERLFTRIEQDPSIVGAVLVSGKPDSWIAGADIDELQHVATAADGEELSRSGQRLLNRLAALPKPFVAAIHGAALGGGLEVALACRYRVATDHPKTVLALPEVQLGLLPGAGGTQRLPRTIGLQAALDMMLTGKNIRAKKAWHMGLVHELVHPAMLLETAMRRVRALARGEATPSRSRSRSGRDMLLEGNALGRALVFKQARLTVLKKTRGHYPAPLAILQTILAGAAVDAAAASPSESAAFANLAVTPVAGNLLRVYRIGERNRRDTGIGADGAAERADEPAAITAPAVGSPFATT